MVYFNLIINSLGLAMFFVIPWLILLFFSDHFYTSDNESDTVEFIYGFFCFGGIVFILLALSTLAYPFYPWYRSYFQAIIAGVIIIALGIGWKVTDPSDNKMRAMLIAAMSVFFAGVSFADQVALQNYSPWQGFLYLFSFIIFWGCGSIFLSMAIISFRAEVIADYLRQVIGSRKRERGRITFSFENKREANRFRRFIDKSEFVSSSFNDIRVILENSDDKVHISAFNFSEFV